MKPPFVYFMRPDHEGAPIKIGFSSVPEQRLVALAAWSPYSLHIMAMAPGDWGREKWLHARFAHLRLHGEWFRAGPDLLRYVSMVRQAGDLPEGPPAKIYRIHHERPIEPLGPLLRKHGLKVRALAQYLGLAGISITDWSARIPIKHLDGVVSFLRQNGIETTAAHLVTMRPYDAKLERAAMTLSLPEIERKAS